MKLTGLLGYRFQRKLVHYLKHGPSRGQRFFEDERKAAERISASGLFDEEWYLRQNKDVAASSYPPLWHYMAYGAFEGRSPGPAFDARWYLNRYPDVAKINPLQHYIDHGRREGRIPVPPTHIVESAKVAVRGVEDLDPELYSTDFFSDISRLEIVDGRPRSRVAEVFETIVNQLEGMPETIVFLPWLIHGGADLVAAHAIRSTADAKGPASVLVVIPDTDRFEANHLLPEDVKVICFSKIDSSLSFEERVELVDLIVRGMQPKSTLNVNSHVLWEATKRYGVRLAKFTRMYAMLFCPDFSPSNRKSGYSDLYFRHCLPYLSGIYFDNASYIETLTSDFGVPDSLRGRLIDLPQPAPPTMEKRPERTESTLKVLWAGRLVYQKNVELLKAIVERAPQFEFHVWGRGEGAYERMVVDLSQQHPNLKFHGAFDGFASLPLGSYDTFLYTSRWDGIPNVLLEAAAARLPIVSSDVGGISELIDDQTGWLINELDDPLPYIQALEVIANQPGSAIEREVAMAARLQEKHNWHRYREILFNQPLELGGLVNGPTDDHRHP